MTVEKWSLLAMIGMRRHKLVTASLNSALSCERPGRKAGGRDMRRRRIITC